MSQKEDANPKKEPKNKSIFASPSLQRNSLDLDGTAWPTEATIGLGLYLQIVVFGLSNLENLTTAAYIILNSSFLAPNETKNIKKLAKQLFA